MSKRNRSRWRLRLAGLVLLVLAGLWAWWQSQVHVSGSLPHTVAYHVWPWGKWLLLVAGLLVLFAVARWWLSRRSPASLVARWSRRSRNNAGLAGWWQVVTRTGRWWLRMQTTVLRPSLRELPWWRR